ncbi:hypothetical protein A0J61_05489 [Choanephora cucurbitarum]|uniref:Uncharacterized protein n=1 Tax=Choanephora cucurbitarum TaxID=101091 RepID=A0A1C7NBM5_9FUNG|nr:hypothetical protein A0J61_05489 [Choanephora cucurbitarum]
MPHSFANYSWTDRALLTTSYRVSCEAMEKLLLFLEGLTFHIQNHVRSERLLDSHLQNFAQAI